MRRLVLATLSGVLIVFSAPPWSSHGLVFVALVPLLLAIKRNSPLRASLFGGVTGGVVYVGGFPWILSAIRRFENVDTATAFPCLVLFVVYHALEFAIVTGGAALLARRAPLFGEIAPFVAAAFWVTIDSLFPKVLPWTLGGLLVDCEFLRQAVDLGGVHLLTFAVVYCNAVFARAFGGKVNHLEAALGVFRCMVVVMAMFAYGSLRLGQLQPESNGADQADVGVVQGGVASGAPIPNANEVAWVVYEGLTTAFHGPVAPDLVVWPETVLRTYLRQDPLYQAKAADLTRRLECPLLLGALEIQSDGNGELNAAFLLDGVKPPQVYYKSTLFPFGEYVPGANVIPFLRRWQTTGRFVEGEPSRAIRLEVKHKGALFAPSICIEATVPGGNNPLIREGSGFLVNLTDDGWFDSMAAEQHLAIARMRAVEARRWLVRASNSGISAFIDPTGRVVQSLSFGAVGTLRQRISIRHDLTPYVRWGNWVVVLCDLITGCVFAYALLRGRVTLPSRRSSPGVRYNPPAHGVPLQRARRS